MFCPKCGKEYPNGAVTCARCGCIVNGGISDHLTWKLGAVGLLLLACLYLWQKGRVEVSYGILAYNSDGVPGPELVGSAFAGYAVNIFLIFAAVCAVFPLVTSRNISAIALLPAKIVGIGLPVLLTVCTFVGWNSFDGLELELTGSCWLLILALCALLVLAFLTTQQIEGLEYYYANTPKLETIEGEVIDKKRDPARQSELDLILLRQKNGTVMTLTAERATAAEITVGMYASFHTEDRKITRFQPLA